MTDAQFDAGRAQVETSDKRTDGFVAYWRACNRADLIGKQYTFCAADYFFNWTDDNWYTWDSKAAQRYAMAARNGAADAAKAMGFKVRKSTMGKQLISRGGIGSGRPHIELWASVYVLTIVG